MHKNLTKKKTNKNCQDLKNDTFEILKLAP